MPKYRTRVGALCAAAMLSAGVAAAPADAAKQDGLLNVAVTDNTIQVPIAVAANICDVSVNVLAEQLDQADNCDAVAGADATSAGGSGGSGSNQRGLVNLAIEDNVVQIPIGIAANICDVSANVLARQADDAAPCTAVADPSAEA